MEQLRNKIALSCVNAMRELYSSDTELPDLQATRKEFTGDLTLVVFPYLRMSRKGPEETAKEIGEYLRESIKEVKSFNVIKGFLNLEIDSTYWMSLFQTALEDKNFGIAARDKKALMVEYSSPNTNKPLHLGHVRNNLLGFSVSELLKAAGHPVYKVQIINDRGIHICKSMVAWRLFGKGETPADAGLKGDHLVGKYYVEFDKVYKKQIEELKEKGSSREEAEKDAPIMQQARQTLKKWEDGDKETVELWQMMNSWVYEGFEETYQRLGVNFDKNYYESNTYLLGKKEVEKGLEQGVFYRKDDGSVWVDLSEYGLDEKLLLRSDGTSVYMTQDIGTAIQRFRDFDISGLIYTVGNEQDYHFKVLFHILDKLGYNWATNLYHLSYGMVDLPSGKMKSREGTVVDADELIDEVIRTARSISEEQGKTEGMNEVEKQALYKMVGLGALKYYLLKVDPRKNMLYNPEESVDFQGNTGPFIQYTHARICSLQRRAEKMDLSQASYSDLKPVELEVLKNLLLFPEMVQEAATQHSPAIMANYIYELVKFYNALYQQLPILTDVEEGASFFRLQLSALTASVIRKGMGMLGIEVPEKM